MQDITLDKNNYLIDFEGDNIVVVSQGVRITMTESFFDKLDTVVRARMEIELKQFIKSSGI